MCSSASKVIDENKPALSDINYDCMLMILEKLDLISLLSVASVNKAYSSDAATVFRNKFSNLRFLIETPRSNDDPFQADFQQIRIHDDEVAVLLLKRFGSEILNLEINYRSVDKTHEVEKFVGLVNQYCPNLIDFTVFSRSLLTFKEVKKPFTNVVASKLVAGNIRIQSDQFTLTKMFPNLHKIILFVNGKMDDQVTSLQFPHLESLELIGEVDVEMINSNRQIRSLVLNSVKSSYIKYLSENMPNLESLNVKAIFVDYAGDIHFRNIKSFRMIMALQGQLGKITYENLEEYECCTDYLDCYSTIRDNPNLKKLRFSTMNSIRDEQLALITRLLPKLEDVDFLCAWVTLDAVIRFLEENKFLTKLHLDVHLIENLNINELKTRTQDKWIVQEIMSHMNPRYLIQRKIVNRSRDYRPEY